MRHLTAPPTVKSSAGLLAAGLLAAGLLWGCQAEATSTGASAGSSTATLSSAAGSSSAAAAISKPRSTIDMTPFTSSEQFDVLITGGQVIDGSGGPAAEADVLIRQGEIAHVGRVAPSVRVEQRIDARGLVVTPGFIDTHSHGDPLNRSKNFLMMGVTTIVVGQDGRSPSDDRIRFWAGRVRKKKLAVNVAALCGHATVRSLAKVSGRKEPSAKQLDRLAKEVQKELADGAWGLSTGLEYQPGIYAGASELVALAKPVAEVDGVIMSHLRSEDDDAIEAALDELIAQGKGAGARVHVAHLKVVYGKGKARAQALLGRLQKARAEGVRITADAYPYNASYTTIGIVFPEWARSGKYSRIKRERHDELAEHLRQRIKQRNGPQATLFGTPPNRGKTLAQVAEAQGEPFEEVLIGLGPRGASAAYFVMDDELQAALLADPHVMISTDGQHSSRHPRAYGAFARLIADHCLKRKLISLPEAVRKMSGLPAQTLRLPRRGLLQAGYAADVLIFDPHKVRAPATYDQPNQLAEGMSWVFVNGRAAIRDGQLSEARGGQLLRRVEQ